MSIDCVTAFLVVTLEKSLLQSTRMHVQGANSNLDHSL